MTTDNLKVRCASCERLVRRLGIMSKLGILGLSPDYPDYPGYPQSPAKSPKKGKAF